jgi:hypothetical protein
MMKRYTIMSSFTVASLTVGCLLAACANGQDETKKDSPPVKESDSTAASDLRVDSVPTVKSEPESLSKTVEEKIPLGPGLQRLADLAMQDLGSILGLEQGEIEVVQAAYVTWRDSALGCPQPGYQYMQVLTNGSRIRLRANKQVYQYHSGGNRPPFLCEKPSKTEPLPYAAGET